MRLSEIETRLAELAELTHAEDADLDAIEVESNELIEERQGILDAAEKRQGILAKVAENRSGEVKVVKQFEERVTPEVSEDEQVRSFLQYLLGEKRDAYVHVTGDGAAVIPVALQNKIYAQMYESHPILKDVNTLRSGAVLQIAKHTSIAQGDAAIVSEATANDDEKNIFAPVTLSGKDFSKHVDFSYRMGKVSIPAFEQYLVSEIGKRLGAAMAADIVAQIKSDVNASNKVESTFANMFTVNDVLEARSKMTGVGKVFVYANAKTIYTKIAQIENAMQTLNFLPNLQTGVPGQLLGMVIREEDAVDDDEIILLDPDQFLYNVVQDVMLERDRDIKKHVHTISGFAIAEGALTRDLAAAVLELSDDPSAPVAATVTVTEVGGATGTTDTASLTIALAPDVPTIAATDIDLISDTGAAIKGALTGEAGTYSLALTSVLAEGDIYVQIAKSGYTFTSAKTKVKIYKDALELSDDPSAPVAVTVTVTEVGGATGTTDTASLTIALAPDVPTIAATDIDLISDTGAAIKGALTGEAGTYSLALTSVLAEGDIYVQIAKSGYTFTSAKTKVKIYKDAG